MEMVYTYVFWFCQMKAYVFYQEEMYKKRSKDRAARCCSSSHEEARKIGKEERRDGETGRLSDNVWDG